MTDLTMIGLGAMGSALANAFLKAGHKITVWNRSPEKAEPFTALGANCAASLTKAVQASPIVVVCIDNYAATEKLLIENDAVSHISGRTIIQLSTGTPKEAQFSDNWIRNCGGEYIDGAIMPYPDGIGADDAQILFAGPDVAYERCKPFLTCLGGDLRFLGDNICAAAVLDMALLTRELCIYLGAIHGVHLCESENVSVNTYASMLPDGDHAKRLAQVVHSNVFDKPGATITVWDGALQRVLTQARDAEINSEIPDLISSLFKRAIAAGYGEEDIAAIVKVMRKGSYH